MSKEIATLNGGKMTRALLRRGKKCLFSDEPMAIFDEEVNVIRLLALINYTLT